MNRIYRKFSRGSFTGMGGPAPTSCSVTTAWFAASGSISERQVWPLSEPCMLYVANGELPSLFTACAAGAVSITVGGQCRQAGQEGDHGGDPPPWLLLPRPEVVADQAVIGPSTRVNGSRPHAVHVLIGIRPSPRTPARTGHQAADR
ncbi:hypothetical protein V7793_09810 [Streptomyces sp. KLMMK]|uniref:hypothetical protein n=1 Tax=Streptomyces sp. KLMMK TaxID=3109353 RepID=UPI00300A669C